MTETTSLGWCLSTCYRSRAQGCDLRTCRHRDIEMGDDDVYTLLMLLSFLLLHLFYTFNIFQPEIEVSKGTIYSQPGSNVTLSCFITGEC